MLRVETAAEHDRARLQSELDAASLRLKAYEALEVEIDAAVVRAAADDDAAVIAAGGDSSAAMESAANLSTGKLLRTVRGIPSNPERRVKQAVFLAQRLLETERHRDELLKKVGVFSFFFLLRG